MASASDLTYLRAIKNTVNFPITSSSSYTTYLKTYTVANSCSQLNTCSLTYPAIPSCACGSSIYCGYNDLLGAAPNKYFGININDSLGNCKYHTFANAIVNPDKMTTTIIRDLPPAMFNPPLKSVQPPYKMKMNTIVCCPDKNIKNSRVKKQQKYYISTPTYPVSMCDNPTSDV